MKKTKNILALAAAMLLGMTFSNAQCCSVVSTNGIGAITTNGICVVAANSQGDCGPKEADTDGDGIVDSKDDCPTVAGVSQFNGCNDTDQDGIADNLDKCPTVAGIESLNGCPEIDTDGDGFADGLDDCPTVKGTLKGCPDTDGDGIIDKNDECPTTAGTAALKGCVDTDGDSVIDPKDKCPTVAGLVSLAGCPDGDSDGVADADDACPTEPGILANKGCPEVSEEEEAILEEAIRGVQFQSGKDIITTSSYAILNNVVKVLTDKPAYKLSIEGHTDSQGRDDLNLDLSKRRAAAVKKYLADKGISDTRLTSEGFGETIPIADNATSAGRAQNRRVELKVQF